MNILDLVSNALGGGALGVVLRIGNGFFEEFKAGRDHTRKLEEAKVMSGITLFRPFITITLIIIATVIYFNSVGPERTPILEQINFAALNCVGWWFGDRMAKKIK